MHLPTSLIAAIAPLLLLGTLSLSVLAEPEHGVREATADHFDAPARAARDVPAVDAAAAVKKDVTEAEVAASAAATAAAVVDDDEDDIDYDDDEDDDGEVVASNSRVKRGEEPAPARVIHQRPHKPQLPHRAAHLTRRGNRVTHWRDGKPSEFPVPLTGADVFGADSGRERVVGGAAAARP